MKPLVIFPDPMLAVLEVLRERLPAHVEGVTLGTKTPDPDKGEPASLPYVLVRQDGAWGTYPVQETATVRLTVWAGSEARALAVVRTARALLLAYEGGAKVRSFGNLTAPMPTEDPDTGAPLGYCTVAARLRPYPL